MFFTIGRGIKKEPSGCLISLLKVAFFPLFVPYTLFDNKFGDQIRENKKRKGLPREYKGVLEAHGLEKGEPFFKGSSKKYPDLEDKLNKVREDYINSHKI